MDVNGVMVYRVVALEKASGIEIGDTLPIPHERLDYDGNKDKIDTEDLFEELRKEHYPHLPSRKSVLYVLPYDLVKVEDWLSLHNPHNDYDYALLTLCLSGSLLWCDEDKFTTAGARIHLRISCANDYWRSASDSYDSFETAEGLFRGIAKVMDIEIRRHISQYRIE